MLHYLDISENLERSLWFSIGQLRLLNNKPNLPPESYQILQDMWAHLSEFQSLSDDLIALLVSSKSDQPESFEHAEYAATYTDAEMLEFSETARRAQARKSAEQKEADD